MFNMGKLTISMAIKRLPEGSSTVQNRAKIMACHLMALKPFHWDFMGMSLRIWISMGLQHLNKQR